MSSHFKNCLGDRKLRTAVSKPPPRAESNKANRCRPIVWRVSPCRESRLGIRGVGWSSAPPRLRWPGTCTARGPSPRTTGASSPACRTGAGSRSSRSQGRWPVPPACTDRIRVCKCDDGIFFFWHSTRTASVKLCQLDHRLSS